MDSWSKLEVIFHPEPYISVVKLVSANESTKLE